MGAEVDTCAGTACRREPEDDPLPFSTGFGGAQIRSWNLRPGDGLYDLVDECPGAQTMVGSRYINLQFARDLISSEAVCSSLAVPIGHYGERFGAVGEFA